jgi:ABC transport system ATP-binding/permease protein
MSASTSTPSVSWTIGNSPDCDLVVGQPVVSGHHCRLSLYGDQYVLEDLGSTNGTFVNGYKLTANSPVIVAPTDTITLGKNVPMPWPSSSAPSPSSSSSSRAARPAGGQVITIGRNPENNIHLDYPMISGNHARVTRTGDQWMIEDTNSKNGVAINRIENRVQQAVLQPTDEIFLGSYKISASRILKEKHITQGESPFERVRFSGDRMVLGRDPSVEYPLNYAMISWRHAALERTSEGIFVEDLGSRNGTYVNGVRISARTLVKAGDEIGLGSFHFQLLADGALAKREYQGNVTIEVQNVAVNSPRGDRLLDSVSLTIFPSELIALMGPAGAGKTTFLKAINGYTPPADGKVLFNGADLYEYYDRFRLQMSYVPQDDIVHPQLTVREALYFSAKLRTDLRDDEIEARIQKVLSSLGIEDKANTIIGSPENKVLSGGQRKRVNIAMELIADAPVIFLDEPTSGLSAADAKNVMDVLKKLSVQDKTTIITTIHQPSLDIYKLFDSLIMICRDSGSSGALVYFGPAYPDSLEFFDPAGTKAARTASKELNPEMLFAGFDPKGKNNNTAGWASTYDQSRYKQLYVKERSGMVPSKAGPPVESEKSAVRKFGFGQWWTLVRRNVLLKIRDRAQAAILLVQAPAFGLLVGVIFGSLNFFNPASWGDLARKSVGVEMLMVVAAIWFGCNNVARDIVGEWTVFQRERMVSLKLPSYVFSKMAVSAVLSLFQVGVLLGIATFMCHLKGDFLSTLGILYLASLVGAALGLCVSARASTTEAAIAMLPLILLPVIALCGGLSKVYTISPDSKPPKVDKPSVVQMLAWVVPSRWAFEADLLMEAKEHHWKDKDSKTDAEQKQLTSILQLDQHCIEGKSRFDPEQCWCSAADSDSRSYLTVPKLHDLAEVQIPLFVSSVGNPPDKCIDLKDPENAPPTHPQAAAQQQQHLAQSSGGAGAGPQTPAEYRRQAERAAAAAQGHLGTQEAAERQKAEAAAARKKAAAEKEKKEKEAAQKKAEAKNEEKPKENRTPLWKSYSILSGMLVFWTGISLLFLKMRDIQ